MSRPLPSVVCNVVAPYTHRFELLGHVWHQSHNPWLCLAPTNSLGSRRVCVKMLEKKFKALLGDRASEMQGCMKNWHFSTNQACQFIAEIFFQNMRTCQAWNMREKYSENMQKNMQNMLRSHVRYKLACLTNRPISFYFENGTKYDHSCNGRRIGTRMRSIEWCHFPWL